jgi:dihydrodipicolinate synthase/N-acetylneuraminate lyase
MICYSEADSREGNATASTVDTWRGVYPAICTPFTEDDVVDVGAQRRVVRFALESGSNGIVAFGLAGEVLKLSTDERRQLTEVIVEEVGGAVPVFVGVGAPSTRASIELARHAELTGVDCVVVPPPLGTGLGVDALFDYFVRIAAAVSVPVMIQDAPAYLGIGIGPDLIGRIGAGAANVRLVKLEAGPSELSHWIDRLGPEFSIWGGDGGMYLLDCLRSGAAGIIPGVDLIDLLVRVYEAELRGESALAEERLRDLLPILVFEMQHSIDHFNACAKRVLVHRGVLAHPGLRAPAGTLAASSARLLDRHLADLQLVADGVRVG